MQSPEYPETPELAASEGGAAARLDHRRCPPWLGAPAHRPHGHPDLVQRPEYPETPEPALCSTKAFSQDDKVVQRKRSNKKLAEALMVLRRQGGRLMQLPR